MSRLHRSILAAFLFLLIVSPILIPKAVPDIRERIALSPCYLKTSDNAKRECAFSIIENALTKDGAAEAVQTFAAANKMFQKLDIDCHAGTHRVGDIMYYSIYTANQLDVSPDDFPLEAHMCNRGFYHGIFEHLFQDHLDPKFVSEICNRFPSGDDKRTEATRLTCFHAAGHGLFRAQTEKISRTDWGNPAAFLTAPAAQCNTLPNTTEEDRFSCVTGVESIFIQASGLKEYGLSDPDDGNGFTVCDQLDAALHPTCYSVRSLMMSQMSNSFLPVLRNCSNAPEPLFKECLEGTIAGLIVNGIHEESFKRSLSLCRRPEILRRNATDACFQQVIDRVAGEYLGEYAPDCNLFPEAFRSACRKAILRP